MDRLQEAQKKAVSLIHNARFVVTKDVSDHTNIHPADKRKVSERVYQKEYIKYYFQENKHEKNRKTKNLHLH